MRRSPQLLSVFVLVVMSVWLVPAVSAAQECQSQALDALARARRARSFQFDFARYRNQLDARFDRLYQWLDDGGHEEGDDVEWSTQFTWLGDNYKFSDYTLCTPQGEKTAQLNGGWNGIALETRNRDLDVHVRLMVFEAGDGVSPDDLPRDDKGSVIFEDDAVGYGQLFYGVYLQVTDWFGMTVGGVTDTERFQHIGTTTDENGDIKSTTTVRSNAIGDPGWYLSATIPRWRLSTDFIFGAAESLDVGMLHAAAIPIPGVEALEALAGGGYLGYEDTGVGYVGARYRPFRFLETTLEAAFEPVRVRSVTGRAEADWSHPFFPEVELFPGELTEFLLGVEAGAFVEASLFNSAYLEAQTGHSNLPGLVAGASLGVLGRPIGVNLEVYGGINPADYLARLVDVVDKPLFGTRLMIRAGW